MLRRALVRDLKNLRHAPTFESSPDNTMDSTHIDERPLKKRRFFREDSSPVVQSIQKFSPPPASPEPSNGAATSPIEIPSDGEADRNGAVSDGFDASLLCAVVGELPPSTVQKLKDQSGDDVQRGTAL